MGEGAERRHALAIARVVPSFLPSYPDTAPPSPTKGVNYQAVLERRKGARGRGGGGRERRTGEVGSLKLRRGGDPPR